MSAGKKRHAARLTKTRLAEMIEQATVDAYGDSEQITGWFTMIEENLAVPFETKVLGVPVTVERVDLDSSEQIVAVCRRRRARQSLPIDDVTFLSHISRRWPRSGSMELPSTNEPDHRQGHHGRRYPGADWGAAGR